MSDDPSTPERRLGSDDIHVGYRNRQDLVHDALDRARGFAAPSVGADGRVSVPLADFRTVVEAFRMTFKTVGETVQQSLRAAPAQTTAYAHQDRGRAEPAPPRPPTEAAEYSEYSEYSELSIRIGDRIEIPADSLNLISTAPVESNSLMSDLLNRSEMMAELASTAAIPGHPPDEGDMGSRCDAWNTGNWFRD